MGLQPPYVSFSRLAKFSLCGEAYRREYVLGEETPSGLHAAAGTAIHEAIRTWEIDGFSSDLLALAKAQLRDVEGLEALPVLGKQDLKWWFTTGLPERVENYRTFRAIEFDRGMRWYNEDPERFLEHEVQVQLDPELPKLHGIIDQVGVDSRGRLFIRDVKTGNPKRWHALQVQFYALAWNTRYPHAPASHAALLYLKGKKPVQRIVPITLTRDHLLAMLRAMVSVNDYPIQGPFTEACGLCAFKPSCPWGQVGERSIL